MIAGIAQISDESSRAVNSALSALELHLDALESALRGQVNTTTTSDWKTHVAPPNSSQLQEIVEPAKMNTLLSRVRSMPQVTEGSFTINNTVIPVNPSEDTFMDIVDRINASSEEVIARYDMGSNRFSLYAKKGNKDIVLHNDNSNFLMEVNIPPGTYHISTHAPMYGIRSHEQSVPAVHASLVSLTTEFNNIMQNKEVPDEIKTTIGSLVEDRIIATQPQLSSGTRYYMDWGIEIQKRSDTDMHMSVTPGAMRALRNDATEIVRFFSGDQTSEGLIPHTYQTVQDMSKGLIINKEV